MNKEIEFKPTNKTQKLFSVSFVFLALYLLIDFLPKGVSIDIEGIQWLGISVLNFVFAVYIAFSVKNQPDFLSFKCNTITLLYTLFITICGISIFFAENKAEGLMEFSKLATAFFGFLLLSIVAQKKQDFLLHFSIFISIILFIQSIGIISNYFKFLANNDIDQLLLSLGGNTGNRNILASSFLFKLPFLFFAINYIKSNYKYFLLLTLFLSTFVLFLTNSKTNVVSLFVFGLVALLFYNFKFKTKNNFKNIWPVYLIIIVSFGLSKSIPFELENVKQENTAYDNLNDYSGSRLSLWKNSLEIANRNPLIGSGLGSYKTESITYEAKTRDDWRISKHSHNDFVQIAAETGYINMLVFILLVFLPFFYSVKKITSKETSEQENWLAFIIILTALGYGFDSLINFPMHRPITQIHFILFLFLFNYSGFMKNGIQLTVKTIFISSVIALLSAATFYPNYKNHQSLIGQNFVLGDEQAMQLSYEEVNNAIPKFPNISALGYSVETLRAKYLIKENRLQEAKQILWDSKNDNKNYRFNESLLAEIYSKEKNADSLLYYRQKCFEIWPRYQPFYQNYLIALRDNKDVKGIEVATEYVKKYNNGKDYGDLNTTIKNDLGKAIKADSLNKESQKFLGIKRTVLTPENVEELNNLNAQFAAADKENWQEILSISIKQHTIQPENAAYNCNIGMAYFKLNQPKKALPYLKLAYESKTMKDGLPEFLLGICNLNSNQREKGCKYLQEAISKGYVVSPEISKNCQ